MLKTAGARREGRFLDRLGGLVTTLLVSAAVVAQNLPIEQLPQAAFTIPLDQATPLDTRISVGRLANGLTYYIRENKQPAKRAELRLVVNAGSALEDDTQLGLAHVLEHMAFNGTEHFQKQGIVSFMESIGMKFGADLNATTDADETIYMLQVPTDKPAYLDTALQIIEDWVRAVTLDPAEIDQERNVVAEEWRLGQGAANRVRNKLLPVLLKDSRYAIRQPIGTLDSIRQFDAKSLKQFYQDWYRPDLMAVVAVGDFDKAEVERQLKQRFENIPAATKPRERKSYDVPGNDGTLFSIITDPELPTTSVTLFHKLPGITDWTPGGMRQREVENFYSTLLSIRFQEMARQPDAPFLGAQAGRFPLVRPASVFQVTASVQESGIKRGLETLLTETEKVKRFGFTQAELDRVKTMYQRALEQSWASRDNRTSASLAAEMIRSYLTGEAIPGDEFEIALRARFLKTITLAEVNQVGRTWIKDANRVVSVTMPEKALLTAPTEADLKEVIAGAANASVKANADAANDAPLLSSKPTPSKVKETRVLNGDITEWTLGNGVKVVVKPSDYKKDEVVFAGFGPGGTSLASDADFIAASTAAEVIANGGIGSFTTTDLQRKLGGKVARVTPFISDYDEGFQGGGSPADLETLFQLIYLRFTAPRADATFYQVFQTQMTTALQNRSATPGTVFNDAFTKLIYDNHPRRQPPTLELLKQTDLARSLTFYRDRFADASGFTFVFAGDLDLHLLQPLVETYLGGLPSTGRKENWKDVGIHYARGVKEETVKRGLEAQARTRIAYSGSFDLKNPEERVRLSATAELLQNRLREVLREQLGGTYNVQVSRLMSWRPKESYLLLIEFGSAPARSDELANAVFSEIDKLKREGPTDVELANMRETAFRTHETRLRQNAVWLSQLQFSYASGLESGADDLLDYPQRVTGLTKMSLRDAYRQFFDDDNRIRLTMLPEK